MIPAVSVIIPTFNRSLLLERAIRSVLSQTYRSFEIVIIDDASTDDTKENLDKQFRDEINDGILRYFKNETKLERCRSRNKGLEIARGEYIAFLDDDDVWLPEHLEVLFEYMTENSDVGCVFSKAAFVSDDGCVETRPDKLNNGKGELYRDLCIEGKIALHSIVMFRNYIHLKIGGYLENINYGEDWEYFSRIAMSYNIAFINRITCCIFVHSGSYSKVSPEEYARIRENIWRIIENNSIRYTYPLKDYIAGRVYLKMARDFIPLMSDSRKYLFKAVQVNPSFLFNAATWSLLLRVIWGRNIYLLFKKLKNIK
jgi:glycosyltransferase involved in cell wall biosynthesis